MFENISEQYGQFIVMGIVFLIGALVYGGYLYYKKQQDMTNVNNNLKNVESVKTSVKQENQEQKQEQQQEQKQQHQEQKKVPQQSPEFVPSETFKGEQKGYSFKKGEKGTGYYKEKTKII